MMNTAVDLKDGSPIPRSGAGRVDAYRAADTGVLAIGDEDLVSLSYGVLYTNTAGVVATKQVSVENKSGTPQVYNTDWAFQTGSMTQTAGADLMVEPAQVTIPAGDTSVVTVTLAFTPSEMMSDFGGLEEYYGFVTLTPDGGMITDALRVPFYFLPRPYAKLTVDADTTIVNPLTDVATITMTHSGPISSSTWIYPALTWNAMPDPTIGAPADVRGFGLDYGGSSPYGDIIAVAIDTWGPWHDPQPYFAEFDLNLDVDQDGTDDYLDFNFNYGWALGGDSTNDWVVIQVDLATGMLYLASPYGIYTDFNASFMEWYLPAAWQDLGPSDSDFGYQLVSFDYFANEQAGTPGQFNYRHPPFAWMTSGDPGPAMPFASGLVGIYDLSGYLYSQPKGVMLVDYAGDPRNMDGAQAYFVPLALGASYLEAGHLAPFAMDPGTAVTVTVSGLPVLTDFAYGDSTGYMPLPPGSYMAAIYPGSSLTPAITGTVNLELGKFYTAIATGDGVNQDLSIVALEDDLATPPSGQFKLRLGNLAPFASGSDAMVDVRMQDGTPILENVDYGDVSSFMAMDAGTVDLKITTPGGAETLIDPLPVTFADGAIVSVFATGDDMNQPLGVFGWPAGVPGSFLPLKVYMIYMPLIAKAAP